MSQPPPEPRPESRQATPAGSAGADSPSPHRPAAGPDGPDGRPVKALADRMIDQIGQVFVGQRELVL